MVDTIEARGYVEELNVVGNRGTTFGMENDLNNLLDNNNANNPINLNRLRGDAANQNADVVVLITHYDEVTNPNPCGIAPIFPHNIDESVAVVSDICLTSNLSLPHEIGHLQGARHNPEETPSNTPFAYQHGHYSVPARERTIMSYDCPEGCIRLGQWSDPNETYGNRGQVIAGSESTHFNAKVLYGSAQYIASLRGGAERYDIVSPTGAFEWVGNQVNRIFNQGDTMDISATFDEPIHVNHPPTVTISDGTLTTPIVMNRDSDTAFSASHDFTTEAGTVTLQFSNAQDLFTNSVIPTATAATGTVTVNIPDTTPPVITLNPPNPQIIELGNGYTELDATTDDGSSVTIDSSAFVDAVGTYSVFYNSVDAANNPAIQVVRTVNVVDNTSPVLTIPVDKKFEATDILTSLTSIQIGKATATDADSNIFIQDNSTGLFPLGDTAILWTATDSSQNTSNGIQTITIKDETNPVITTPSDVIANFGDTITLGNPSVTDIFFDSVTNNSTGLFPLGDTTILWTAIDTSGNEATATQRVTINPMPIPTNGTISSYNKITSQSLGTSDGLSIGFGSGDLFGYKTTDIGDVDGNGVIDMAVIAFHENTRFGNAYLVLLNSNGTLKESHELSNCGNTQVTSFGEALDYLGEIKGNPTILVSNWFVNEINIITINKSDYSHTCSVLPTAGPTNTWSLVNAGFIDLNGNNDEIPDIVIGTMNTADTGTSFYILDLEYLNSQITTTSTQLIDTSAILPAMDWDNRWFENIIISEIDGDSNTLDLVIGEPRQWRNAQNFKGEVIVAFVDKTTFAFTSTSVITPVTLDDTLIINSPNANHFGIGLANVGDLNVDGIDDIVIGMEGNHDGHNSQNSGAVYVVFMNSDGTAKSYQKISNLYGNLSTDNSGGILSGGDMFGKGLGAVIDLDRDGLVELIVGAHSDNTGGSDAGAIYILSFNKDQ